MKFKTLIIISLLLVPSLIYAQNQSQPNMRLITVQGQAEIKVVPDEIVICLGVRTLDKELNIVKTQADERIKAVLALIKEIKIDPKDVQTSYMSVHPVYADYRDESTIKAYSAEKTISIILKDTSKLEELIEKSLKVGANNVYGIYFKTSELKKYREEARKQALLAAQEKATKMASALGLKIGKPYSIEEENVSSSIYYNRSGQSQYANIGIQGSSSADMGSGGIDGSFALGQIPVVATVVIQFELVE